MVPGKKIVIALLMNEKDPGVKGKKICNVITLLRI
jgi:hypothetical protein